VVSQQIRGSWRCLAAVSVALLLAVVCAGVGSARAEPVASRTVVTATDKDNGRTIVLRPGQRLRVVLGSTYWQFRASSNPAVLRLVGTPKTTPRSGCMVGAGCGTETATFVAAAAGRAVVTAGRTSCGEAMGCTPAASRFMLHVVVRAAS
jgi:hypothetical protein